MAFLSEIRDTRLALLKYFLSDQELVDLISLDTGHGLPAFDLEFKQVFPFPKIVDTVTDKRVFLCFKLASRTVAAQTKRTTIKVFVFMHNDLMVMPNCLRQDAIIARVETLLNGNENLGLSDVEFVAFDQLDGLPKDYYGVWMEYSVNNLNRWKC
jgi:hypothetical protein